MKRSLASLKADLAHIDAVRISAGGLARIVPHIDLGPTPDWLYTSGRPNRYNPRGVDALYFGESREVAQAEYDHSWGGLTGADQPTTTFYAEVSLARVLDLTDASTLNALNLAGTDLLKPWRGKKTTTFTQLLGHAVQDSHLFSAIRYPSHALALRGQVGAGIVIFRDGLHSPDFVRILGPGKKPLQQWP